MRYRPHGRVVFTVVLVVLLAGWTDGVWAQGRGRGATPAPAAQGTTAQAPGQPPAGRGGRGAGSSVNFYDFDATAQAGMAMPDAPPVETHQKITLNGAPLAYTTRAGFLPLRNATTGQTVAHLFFTYYAKDGADAAARPLVVFVGGAPGVAAAWQEFAGLGPKRMRWAADGTAGPPPYAFVDNPHTLLGEADLVFANPVGTAYSRPEQPTHGPDFWTAAGDVASLGEFVRSFTNMYGRRNTPLFVAGEDAATGRAAGLAAYLIEHQTPVSGVILLSMAPAADAIAGDEQYITLLPSFVLAAWHHKKLAPDLQSLPVERIAEQARQFASREFLHALYKGHRMATDERGAAIAGLSRMTGLSPAFVTNNDLRVTVDRFAAELFRADHRALSTSDARVTGYAPAPTGGGRGGFGGAPAASLDYTQSGLAGGFLTAYETYLRRDLGFTGSGVFYLSGGGVGTFASTGSDDTSLAVAFARDPRLRVFIAADYFDLGAPFYATEFTVAHLSVSPEVRARNIVVRHYEAGRMAYADRGALPRLHADLAKFLNDAAAPARTRPEANPPVQ